MLIKINYIDTSGEVKVRFSTDPDSNLFFTALTST